MLAAGFFLAALSLCCPGFVASSLAQGIVLGKESIRVATFPDHTTSIRIPCTSSTGYSINATTDSGGWLNVWQRGDFLDLYASNYQADDHEALVTLSSGSARAPLRVQRTAFSYYREPQVAASPATGPLWALYQNDLLAYDSADYQLLASASFPESVGGPLTSGATKTLSLSDDGQELRAYFSATSTWVRLDPTTLATRSTLVLPDVRIDSAPLIATHLTDATPDALYVLRYAATTLETPNGQRGLFPSLIEVRHPTDGRLLQALRIPAPASAVAGLMSIDSVASHPFRPEIWVQTQHTESNLDVVYRLLRFTRLPDGTLGTEVAPPLELARSLNQDPYYGLTRYALAARPTFAFTRSWALAGFALLDDRGNAPMVKKTFYTPFGELSPDGSVVIIPGSIHATETSATLILDQGKTLLQVSPDSRHVALLDTSVINTPTPRFVSLSALFAQSTASQVRAPLANSIVAPPSSLSWTALPGADSYRIYLADTADALLPATPDTRWRIGESTGARLDLPSPLAPGDYYWRVDALVGAEIFRGAVQRFSASHARVENLPVQTYTMAKTRRRDFTIQIETSGPSVAWNLVAETPWLQVRSGSGVGPGTAIVSVDATTFAGQLYGESKLGSLRLGTADATVSVPVRVAVDDFDINQTVPIPGSSLVLARGSTCWTQAAGWQRYVLLIDTVAQAITRCTPVPNPGEPLGFKILAPLGANGPLYVHPSPRPLLIELDPVELTPRREISLLDPNNLLINPAPLATRDDGKLWVRGGSYIGLFDPATATYLSRQPITDFAFSHLSPDGAVWLSIRGNADTSQRVQSVDLRQAVTTPSGGLGTITQTTLDTPNSQFGRESLPPAFSRQPRHFACDGFIFDDQLARLADLDDYIYSLAEDGSAALGRSLIYLGPTHADVRALPGRSYSDDHWHYCPTSRVVLRYDGNGFDFFAVDALPGAPEVGLETLSVADTEATFAYTLSHTAVAFESFQTAYRPAGSGGRWTYGGGTAMSLGRFRAEGLAPLTDYELRIRLNNLGAISGWSAPVLLRTTLPRPRQLDSSYLSYLSVKQGYPVSIPLRFQGDDLVWTIENGPAGLVFDPTTRQISGLPSEPGRYSVTIRASNAGGEISWNLSLNVVPAHLGERFARYSGLFTLEGGPLSGAWAATRTGDILTGTYRSPLFTRSFKVNFAKAESWNEIGPVAQTKISYDGVPIYLTIFWDKTTDRIRISSFAEGEDETIEAATEPGMGVATHWATKTLPYPHPLRFTHLMIPGEGEGAPLPEGIGFFTLLVDKNGLAKLTGETNTGFKLTQSQYLSDLHQLPFFQSTATAFLHGSLEIIPAPVLSSIGTIYHFRDENRKATSYRQGFAQELLVLGTPLPAIGKKLPALAPLANPGQRADFLLSGGGLNRLSKPIAQALVPTATGLAAPKSGSLENPHRVLVKLAPATGLVTGSAAVLDATGRKTVRSVSFRGMFLKDPLGDGEDVIGGYYLFPDAAGLLQSGRLEINEPDADTAD